MPAPELERYLRRATWGLPRARRQELRDELEEHALSRAHRLTLLGLSPPDALKRALRDLGPPERVGAGMSQVYLMPMLIRSAALLALGLTVGLNVLSAGQAQVGGLSNRPAVPICVSQSLKESSDIKILKRSSGKTCFMYTNRENYRGAYINVTDLSKFLRSRGFAVNEKGKMIRYKSTNAGGTIIAEFTQNGIRYDDASDALIAFIGTTDVMVTGYQNPTTNIGKIKLTLGTNNAPIDGFYFYRGLLGYIGDAVFTPESKKDSPRTFSTFYAPPPGLGKTDYPQHVIQTDLSGGEVVMLAMRVRNGPLFLNHAVVQADGTARLFADWDRSKLTFVRTPQEVTPYLSGGRAQAMLVRLTNTNLSQPRQGIFVPGQTISDATN